MSNSVQGVSKAIDNGDLVTRSKISETHRADDQNNSGNAPTEQKKILEATNGRNGSQSNYGSSIILLRSKLQNDKQTELKTTNKHHIIRSILGIQTCDVPLDLDLDLELDLDNEDVLSSYLTTYSLDQIGYLNSVDFNEGRLPNEDYLYIENPENGQKIYFEQFDNDAKRLFLLAKVFNFDYNMYLEAFRAKLCKTARNAYKLFLLKELNQLEGSNFDVAIDYLRAETSKEFHNVRTKNFHQMNGTYDWVIDFIDKNPKVAERMHRYMRNGQRYFVRALNDNARVAGLMNGHANDTLNFITIWIKSSPQAFYRVATVLDDLMEDISIGPNRLSYELSNVENKVRDLTEAKRWSILRLIGLGSGSNSLTADSLANTELYTGNMKIEQVLDYIDTRVSKCCIEAYKQEKNIVDDLKIKARREVIKTGAKWTGGALLVAALGGGGIATVSYINSQNFQKELSRVESEVAPFLRISYERIYNEARTEMGDSYPPEAKDTRNLANYAIQQRKYSDFLHALHNKYFKILAAYLTPNLPESTRNAIRNGSILGLPNDLRTNLFDDLRNLFTTDEWNFPEGVLQNGRIYYGHMIGQGMIKDGIPQPGVLEEYRAGNLSAVAYFLHPQPFPAIRRESQRDPSTRQLVFTDRFIEPPPEREVFRGTEPRDYIEDWDPNYLNITTALHEILSRLERRKQQILLNYENSPEVQELNQLLTKARETEDIESKEVRINEIKEILDQRQRNLQPILRGIARCECRLKDLIEVRIPNRVNDIKTRNSYRALVI